MIKVAKKAKSNHKIPIYQEIQELLLLIKTNVMLLFEKL